jgi:hypothetical protein
VLAVLPVPAARLALPVQVAVRVQPEQVDQAVLLVKTVQVEPAVLLVQTAQVVQVEQVER